MARETKEDNVKIEHVETKSLIPYARNSRTHSDDQVRQIMASIREFGFTNPVLIDDAGMIIAGHGRVMAASRMGMDEVPCIRLGYLNDRQKRAYVIADNKLALNAGWDENLLAAEMKAIESDGFDMALLGFDDDELKELLAVAEIDDGNEKDPDIVPKVEELPVSKDGDIWVLGNHRLMCGDSTSMEAMASLMGGGYG